MVTNIDDDLESNIADNIKEAVKYPEFFELDLLSIKNILEKIENIDIQAADTIIRCCCEKYDDECLSILPYIDIEDEFINDFLGSLDWVPVLEKVKSLLKESNDCNFESLKRENERLKKEAIKKTDNDSSDDGSIEFDWEAHSHELEEIKNNEIRKLKEEIDSLKKA